MIAGLIAGARVAECQEERIQKLMLPFISANDFTLEDLYRVANIPEDERAARDATRNGMDLEILVSIYCARDKNFDACYIKGQ